MMNRFLLFALTTTTLFGQSLDDIVVPNKTELFITLERSISSKTALAGDKFYGTVSVPLTLDDRIVIPVGSYIIGEVGFAREAGYVKGKSQLALKFNTVILPGGLTRQIEAVVQSAEGYRGSPGEEGKIEAPGNQGEKTAASAAGGAVTGAAIGAVAGRGWKGAGVGAAVGVVGGSVLGIFQKGDPVVLPKGTSITVQFYESARFVKPQSRNPGKRLTP